VPFKFEEMFFSGLINLLRGVFGKCGVRCKFTLKLTVWQQNVAPEINVISADVHFHIFGFS
jgi:hypothetical protein